MSAERLQKVLASAGIASRRDCEELIAAGRVSVNGKVVTVPGTRVDPAADEIAVDGQSIGAINPRTYVMLHKPAGVVSTADDPQGRPTVVELVDLPARLFTVGRLDYDSEGLLLLTDDGELTQRLTHPSYQVEKEYRALLDQPPSAEALREWRGGVTLEGAPTAPAWVDVLERGDDGTWVRVVLQEGRKRQIREVAKLLGYNVLRLIRVREGPVLLGDLPAGEWRKLTDEEVEALWSHVGGRDAEMPQPEPAAPRRARPAAEPAGAPENAPAGGARTLRPSRAPRRDDRQERGGFEARGPRRDERAEFEPREPRGEQQNDQGGFDSRGPRRDERDSRGGFDSRGPRRDERDNRGGFDSRGPRRDERDSRGGFDSRGPRRDERDSRGGFDSRGPRQDNRGGFDSRGPRQDNRGGFDSRGPRRDERDSRGGFDSRGPRPENRDDRGGFEARAPRPEGAPERGNERRDERPLREEKRGPGREWHERTSQEQREKRTSRFGMRGGSARRTGFPFRARPRRDTEK